MIYSGVHWKDYPAGEDGKGISAREGIFGVGQTHVREDHYAAHYRWKAGKDAPNLG